MWIEVCLGRFVCREDMGMHATALQYSIGILNRCTRVTISRAVTCTIRRIYPSLHDVFGVKPGQSTSFDAVVMSSPKPMPTSPGGTIGSLDSHSLDARGTAVRVPVADYCNGTETVPIRGSCQSGHPTAWYIQYIVRPMGSRLVLKSTHLG